MNDILPRELFETIQKHLVVRGNQAEDGWEAGSDEEDTLTGHLGATLQRGWSRRYRADGHTWRWRVRYKKFRGRGKGALEKECGADGIVQIEVQMLEDATSIQKGILFQSKKGDVRPNKRLSAQVDKMERLAPHGSAIFTYEETGYRGIAGHDYLTEMRNLTLLPRGQNHRLGTMLGEHFLACKIGMRGMYYDALRKQLIVPENAGMRFLHLDLRHRISVEVVRQ